MQLSCNLYVGQSWICLSFARIYPSIYQWDKKSEEITMITVKLQSVCKTFLDFDFIFVESIHLSTFESQEEN